MSGALIEDDLLVGAVRIIADAHKDHTTTLELFSHDDPTRSEALVIVVRCQRCAPRIAMLLNNLRVASDHTQPAPKVAS